MDTRRWLPYRSLQTRHLALALATARVIAWIGMLLVAAGVAYGIAVAIQGGGSLMTLVLGTVFGLVGYGLVAMVVSGVLAAAVGVEESQRRRIERE